MNSGNGIRISTLWQAKYFLNNFKNVKIKQAILQRLIKGKVKLKRDLQDRKQKDDIPNNPFCDRFLKI